MSIHNWLEKRVNWYKKWHEKSYYNLVHCGVFVAFSAMDFYLLYQLQILINIV